MRYSVEIDRSIDSLAHCMNKVNKNIDSWDWTVEINAGGINYGIYFNFDLDRKELEICNQPRYDDSYYLDDIIDMINEDEEDDEDE